jgi:hypothetical protein
LIISLFAATGAATTRARSYQRYRPSTVCYPSRLR